MSPEPRLVFAIHDLNAWGGHDRSTLEIARRLSHRWPVDVYSYTLDDPLGMESWGRAEFHRIRPHFRRPAALKLSLYYAATLPALKLRPRSVIHATGSCSLVSDVVQVQFVQAAWKERLARNQEALPARGLRQVYHRLLLDYNVAVERAVYSRRKTYIAIAHCVADELRRYFGLEERVHVIHHGVDSELFRPAAAPLDVADRVEIRRELGIGDSEALILFVGAYDRKGLKRAIEAMALLSPPARARARLVAIGGGDPAPFERSAAGAGVRERVSFLGHRKDIERCYRAGDVFLLPTLYEPFGLVILEAMASGLAPIVSRLAGASELFEPESGALIDDPASAAEIASKLEPVVMDAALRRRMAENSRRIAKQRSWDQVAREYEAVLGPLMQKAGER